MAYFLLQGAYASDAWKSLVANPQNRVEVVRPVIERLGGSVEGAWFTFGEYDVVLIMQLPDNVSAAAFAFALASGGAFKSHKTTPLMTMEEAIEAMRKAGGAGYKGPGS
jgi:uncharacterized protein with GYD domain